MEKLDNLYKKAYEIAVKAHAGQFDKGGHPYIEHPVAVAACMETAELKIIAMLHDTLEDSCLTAEDLRREGFSERIVGAVLAMTHKGDDREDYLKYIEKVAENPLAVIVKRADIWHNMDISRIKEPTERDFERLDKYRKALEILNKCN